MFKYIYTYCGGKFQSYLHPAISRRFIRFAKRNNINLLDFYQSKNKNGVIILSQAADFTYWVKNKNSNNIYIFDANDPYLLDNKLNFKNLFRGIFKYFSGNHKYLEFNYKNSFFNLCNKSNCIVVGHFLLYEKLNQKFSNVFLIPDYSIERDILQKHIYEQQSIEKINIFWEGLGSSYLPFSDVERIFKKFTNKYNFEFHFVTDLTFFSIGDKYFRKNIINLAKKMAPTMFKTFKFYEWSEVVMNKIAISCDFSIIPLPIDDSINYFKPENKLIHMWRMKIPTIVSAIPSYINVMNQVQLDDYCYNDDEWVKKIQLFCLNSNVRKKNGEDGFIFVNNNYSNEIIDQKWRNVLNFINEN
jgi:hypothetical protein